MVWADSLEFFVANLLYKCISLLQNVAVKRKYFIFFHVSMPYDHVSCEVFLEVVRKGSLLKRGHGSFTLCLRSPSIFYLYWFELNILF